MASYLQPYKKYADFSGRASRLEYWSFYLFHALVSFALIVLGLLMAGLGLLVAEGVAIGALVLTAGVLLIFSFGSLIPFIAVAVRRLHDKGLSAWYLLITFIPFIGGIAMIVLFCLPGEAGDNAYGVDPKSIGE